MSRTREVKDFKELANANTIRPAVSVSCELLKLGLLPTTETGREGTIPSDDTISKE